MSPQQQLPSDPGVSASAFERQHSAFASPSVASASSSPSKSKARRESSPAPSAYSRTFNLFADFGGGGGAGGSGSADSLDADAGGGGGTPSDKSLSLNRKSRTDMTAKLFGLFFGERLPAASSLSSVMDDTLSSHMHFLPHEYNFTHSTSAVHLFFRCTVCSWCHAAIDD